MFQSDLYHPLTISCTHGHGCHSRTQGLTSRRSVKACYVGSKMHFPRNSKEEVQCWILLHCIKERMYFGKLQSFFFSETNGWSSKTNCRFIFNFYFISLYMPLRGDVFYMTSTFLYNPHWNCIPNIYATANKYKINHNFKN